eukprot:scaffold128033_cov46-Cyclotella_meneghiniana.AAC.3
MARKGKVIGSEGRVNRGANGWQGRWRGRQPTAAPQRAHQGDRSIGCAQLVLGRRGAGAWGIKAALELELGGSRQQQHRINGYLCAPFS